MKYLLFIPLAAFIFISCEKAKKDTKNTKPGWNSERVVEINPADSLVLGSSYLPVYSQIYQHEATDIYGLTITVSLRNISEKDSLYITRADYYNSAGVKD